MCATANKVICVEITKYAITFKADDILFEKSNKKIEKSPKNRKEIINVFFFNIAVLFHSQYRS